MENTTENYPFSKQEIQNMKFPTKLWLLINTPNKIIKWNTKGSGVIIDFVALDNYLCSSVTLFKTKSRSGFIRQLNAYGFKNPETDEQDEETKNSSVLYEYKNENFQQGRVDLISKIAKSPGFEKQLANLTEVQERLIKQPNRQYDPCCSIIKSLSNMERARLNLRIILQVQAENYTLRKKLSECEQKSPSSSVSVIELPAEAFENPYESISRFEENPEYAGFYGHATTEQVKQFFDEYLPIYAQANGDEVIDKSLGDNASQHEESYEIRNISPTTGLMDSSNPLGKSEDPASGPPNFQIKYSVSLDSNENKEYTLNILEETCSQATSGLDTFPENKRTGSDAGASMNPMSSSLEPIFACDEEADVNSKEEDISMDQYLKFKRSPQKDDENIKDIVDNIKSEDVENEGESKQATDEDKQNTNDNENSDNFKNFFNQYRESINLLYD